MLKEDGNLSGGLIHLYIDGVDVGPAYTVFSNSTTGQWSITYQIPSDMDFGQHQARVEFLGGSLMGRPNGQGDSVNPEYYLGSTDSLAFNVTQTSQVVISTSPSEIDRTEVATVEGMLTDGVGGPSPTGTLSFQWTGRK